MTYQYSVVPLLRMKRSNSRDLVVPVSKRSSLSSSSSIKDDDHDTKPQSLFVVVSYSSKASICNSIVQLGTQGVNNHSSRKTSVTSDSKVFSAHFRQPYRSTSLYKGFFAFSPLANCTEDLYMVPDDARLHGYKFNLMTNELTRIQRPSSFQFGNVVSLRDRIYRMPDNSWRCDASFERYNPVNDSWEPRKPLPAVKSVRMVRILATAVWDDTILMNVDKCHVWAYNGGRDEWYSVHVEDKDCYSIEGEAVVVENKTIYALTKGHSETILALSVKIEEKNNGDLAYTCSLLSKISVPGMLKIEFDDELAYFSTRHLVHLGKDNFCLVQSCRLVESHRSQPIQVTYMKNLRGQNKMIVTEICVNWMKVKKYEVFRVCLCFSLPERMTTALKQGKRRTKRKTKVFDLYFDPFSPGSDYDEDEDDSPRRSARYWRDRPRSPRQPE